METAPAINDLRVGISNRQILSIALPITLSILIPQVNWLTNAIFLGRLSTEALGNAGITGVFYLIFAVAGAGLSNAMQTVFSRDAGSGDTQYFNVILIQGIRISIIFSLLCVLFTWLIAPYIMQQVSDPHAFPAEMGFLKIRILGLPFLFLFQLGNSFLISSLNSRYLMIGFVCEALINIIFDYFLIFGKAGFPALGFNGAAVASVIAEASGMVVVLMVIIFTQLKKKYNLFSSFSFHKKITSQILTISVPLVFQYVISVTTWLIFFLLIESRGLIAKAISNTMRNVFGIAGVFVWAFASTCNTMVSNLIGQHREDLVMLLIKKIMFWSIGLCLLLSILLNIFPHFFFSLFGQSEEFVKEAIPVIRMVSPGIVFMGIANVWLNGVTGTGKTKMNLAIELVAISFYLVYTWYFMKVNYISLAIAWSNEFVYWGTIFIMAYWYMSSGKWKKHQVDHF